MSTTPNVPYRLEFSVEVPGTPEQVWQAIATAKGMSAWFLPTEMEEREGGSRIVRVTSSGFGTGAAWESEFWDDMGLNWMPFFDNLRLYLSHFPGQEATQLEVTASHPGDAEALWSTLRDALGLGEEGT